jgi:hypothetical protein
MARGFESKDVEFQQAEAARARTFRRSLAPDERGAQDETRALELSLTRARSELASARTAAHRQMLLSAIASLEERLAARRA